MAQELESYTTELEQVREDYVERIARLSEKLAQPDSIWPNRFVRGSERIIQRLIPWFKETRSRAESALAKEQSRLALLQSIRSLSIELKPAGAWRSVFEFENPPGHNQLILHQTVIHQHLGRSNWTTLQFAAYRYSNHHCFDRMDQDQQQRVGWDYQWIVSSVMLQRNLNFRAKA